jgi:hypothetical protein
MATFTAHYNLRKPAVGDLMTVGADISANMDIIDDALDDHEDRLDVVEARNLALTRKPSNENVTSSATFQADDHLIAAIGAGTWLVDFYVAYDGAAAGDIQVRVAWDNTATVHVFFMGLVPTATAASGPARMLCRLNDSATPLSSTAFGADASNVRLHIHVLVVSTNSTTLTLEWSQDNSNATPTSVKEGSHVQVRKVA